MKKSRVVRLLGPAELTAAPVEATDFELCAVVDPLQRECVTAGDRGVPVYRDLLSALRKTRVSTVIYGNFYIDINGCDSIRGVVGR
ncbi:hypothetical protein [Gemmobacter denitrificans]|uniref:Uncharacterized protein n=1 Tax=Gemmobacter denitrificans TaxID=3123040 RepID=A0ABU8BT55_9RHOB